MNYQEAISIQVYVVLFLGGAMFCSVVASDGKELLGLSDHQSLDPSSGDTLCSDFMGNALCQICTASGEKNDCCYDRESFEQCTRAFISAAQEKLDWAAGSRDETALSELDKRAKHFLGKRVKYFLGKRNDEKRAKYFLGK